MSLSISSSSAGHRRQRASRRFLALWSICVAGCFLAVAGLNVWVDPLGRLGRNTLGIYHSAEFEYKVAKLPTAVFDGLLTGSSKVANIDPAWISEARLFNAAFSGALPEEMALLLRTNAEHLRNKFVVIGLDFFMFNEETKSIRGDTLVAPSVTDIVTYLLSIRTTYFSLQTLLKHSRGEQARMRVNGSRYIDDLIEKDRDLAAPDYADKIDGILRSLYADYRFSHRRIAVLRDLCRDLDRYEITCQIVLNPQNEVLLAAAAKAGLGDEFDTYRSELASAFPDVIDLSQSEFSTPAHFFHQSPFYFRPDVMREMVSRALGSIGRRSQNPLAEQKG